MTTRKHWTAEGERGATAIQQAPVVASLGFRAAAATDQCASLARLLSPVLDVLIRLWLAGGFLVTDALQHMAPGSRLIVQEGGVKGVSNMLPVSMAPLVAMAW